MKKIILTGGGTAGHVTPNFALIPYLQKDNVDITYIGSYNGIEKQLVKNLNLKYIGISSGKLRRYFDIKNFTDPFRILKGILEAIHHLKHIKPDLIFSKGGFVTVPVAIAGFLLKIPVIIHESDITPGLANKLAGKFAIQILTSFEETLKYLPVNKAIFTGAPVRNSLSTGIPEKAFEITGLRNNKPVIMMMGGSLGSVKINSILRQILPSLLKNYNLIHLCGKNNLDATLNNLEGYVQYEYVSDELKHLFSITDMMITRAGSNAINELLYLKIPNILIPLSKEASRGDQILNANVFHENGYSLILEEENLTKDSLLNKINELFEKKDEIKNNMELSTATNGALNIYTILKSHLH